MAVLLIVLTIIAIGVDVVVLLLLLRWARSRYLHHYRFEVGNLGNIGCRYELRVETPLEGVKLHFVSGVTALLPSEQPVSEAPLAQARRAGSVVGTSGAAEKVQKVSDAAGRARGISQMVAGVVAGIGGLLPASVGQPLRDLGAQMRKGQAQAARIERTPAQTKRRVTSVTKGAAGQRRTSHSVVSEVEGSKVGSSEGGRAWGQTDVVVPGDEVLVELVAMPVGRPRETRDYPIEITSRVVDVPVAPVVKEVGHLKIVEVSWFQHLWLYLAYGLALVLEIWVLLSIGVNII